MVAARGLYHGQLFLIELFLVFHIIILIVFDDE